MNGIRCSTSSPSRSFAPCTRAGSVRDLVDELAKRKRPGPITLDLAGRMETELAGARLALESMLAAVAQRPVASHQKPRRGASRRRRHRAMM